MKTKLITAVALSAALLGVAASAGAAGLSPTDRFASTQVLFRGDVITQAPRPHGTAADAPTVQARKGQAPSSYELHSRLVRAPVNPQVVRAQGE